MKIGEKIRNVREDLDLSQEYVARQIPMNQSGYSKIERDIQEPSLYQLKRICEILNISADNLLSLRVQWRFKSRFGAFEGYKKHIQQIFKIPKPTQTSRFFVFYELTEYQYSVRFQPFRASCASSVFAYY